MWAGIAAGGGAVLGGLLGAKGATDAAKEQAKATQAAIAEQQRQYNTTRADQRPYRISGSAALARLDQGLGLGGQASVDENDPAFQAIYQPMVDQFDRAHTDRYGFGIFDSRADASSREAVLDRFKGQAGQQFSAQQPSQPSGTGDLLRKFTMEDFQNDPVSKASFDFGLSEGEKAVQRMFGARGLSRSGAAVKAASRFATDYTGTKAGESQARFVADQTNTYNRLAGVAGTGQTAANTVANAGTNMANNVSGLLSSEGNARGAAAIARTNAIGGAINQVGNQIYGQYTLDRVLNRGGITGASGGATAPQYSMDV